MDNKTIIAVNRMLKAGFVVELFLKPDGTVKVRTVVKKDVKT